MSKMRWRTGFRPDPAGGPHDASPDPLIGWGGGTLFSTLTLSSSRFSRLRRSASVAPNVDSWLRP